jgi:hypothetical protein
MTKVRRLLVVTAGLAVTALASIFSSSSHGEGAGKPNRSAPSAAARPTPVKAPAASEEAALAASKFETSSLVTYQPLEGDLLFALQVKPKVEPGPARPRDYVIMVSNSAAQAGSPRTASLQIVDALLKKLGDRDRVSLWIVSTPDANNTRCLTKGWLSPNADSKKIGAAVTELKTALYPAGDTDLKTALEGAVGSFEGGDNRQQVLLFLGDGLSTHNPISAADRAALCRKMVDRKIAFFSVPLGVRMSPENLHGLATGTGGAVLRVHLTEQKLADALKQFENAFAAPIVYSSRLQMPAEVTEFYPTQLPPLRTDTPTLVVGRMKSAQQLAYSLQGQIAGTEATVNLPVREPVKEAELDNYFLVSMLTQWKNAKSEPALIRGDRALALAFEQNRLELRDRIVGGQLALRRDELDAAQRLFEQAKQLKPHDKEAAAGLKIINDLRDGKASREKILRELDKSRDLQELQKVNGRLQPTKVDLVRLSQLEEEPVSPKAGGQAKPGAVEREDLFQAHRDRVILEEQRMSQAVEENLRQARRELKDDPDASLELLNNTLARVRDHADLGDRVREALISRLQTALRDVAMQGKAIKLRKIEQQQILSQVQKNLDEEQKRKTIEERTEAQVKVFKGLVNVARVEEKTRQEMLAGLASMESDLRLRGAPVPTATRALYEQVGVGFNLNKWAELRKKREEGYLATLMTVEKSNIPFPDEPGIYFPPLATWEAISRIRKGKYEVSSLPDDPKGREEANKLYERLNDMMDLSDEVFKNPMSLQNFIDILDSKHKIAVLVDTAPFKAENESEYPNGVEIYETKIQFPPAPKRMTIATALRLALSQVKTDNATYVIRRNFVEVTTIDRQFRDKVLRVYPVGDLVIPISMGGFSLVGGGGQGGFAGQFGIGGFSGGQGQLGLQFGQLGGGIGGFGGGQIGLGGGLGGFGGQIGLGGGLGGFGGQIGLGGGLGGFGGQIGLGGFGGQLGLGGALGIGGQNPGFGGVAGAVGQLGQIGLGGAGGGAFQGGFNGSLGAFGATQAQDLINVITKTVDPKWWFVPPPPQPINQFLGGALGLPAVNFGNQGMQGGAGPTPPPFGQGGPPPDLELANTIEFFPPALALIVRGQARIHTSITGGIIGGKRPKVAEGIVRNDGDGRIFVRGPNQGGNNQAGNNAQQLVRAGNSGGNKTTQGATNKILVAQAGPNGKKGEELDPTKVWHEVLAKGGVEPGHIIATADFLFETESYVHVAEFLKANLRFGIVVRPWVYEALAVALEASNGSPEEIRRARLSAIALDPQDAQGFLAAAQTMADHKQWDRALAFCRQAALLEPNRAQPYTEALAFAELGKDSKAMEWAVDRLLSQDWPVDNKTVQTKAQAKLEALATVLDKDQRRQTEAQRLREALQRLRQRDLVINLTWDVGHEPADLSLEVKEPGGSICSAKARQTSGGGTYLGNNLLDLTRVSYMAAQGFPGDYQITVRRNWGQPLGGRARLEIIQHLGTPQETRRLEIIRLDQTNTFTVTVDRGRRTALANVPPPGSDKRAPKNEERQEVSALSKLRALAHPDFSGATGLRGSAGTPGARIPGYVADSRRATETPPRVDLQSAIVPPANGGVNLNVQATLADNAREIQLRLTPVFQTVGQNRGSPSVNLPLIPGGLTP